MATLLFTAALLCAAQPALAQGAVFIGAGSSDCHEWSESRKRSIAATMESWVLGYLSGLAISGNKDVLQGTNAPTVFQWIDGYCKANPSRKVIEGATELFTRLSRNPR